ncbi:MAG: hypothetical protein DRJ35_04280 [Thermoprotei archaeon]|nr:MAG: hypothetical protein DRJ35_04280 [Thermoprotei archaeon]
MRKRLLGATKGAFPDIYVNVMDDVLEYASKEVLDKTNLEVKVIGPSGEEVLTKRINLSSLNIEGSKASWKACTIISTRQESGK